MGEQLDMFSAWQPEAPKAWWEPVDGLGHVVQGKPDETLELPHPRKAWSLARIELHRHSDGRWMWSASGPGCGSYKVGPKWGRFAETREGALYHAAQELVEKIDRIKDPVPFGITRAQLSQMRSWALECAA